MLRKLLREGKGLITVFAVGAICTFVFGLRFGVVIAAVLGCVVLSPLLVLVFLPLFGPSAKMDRLLRAVAWARWQEVLEWLPPLEKTLGPLEAAFRRAEAFAGLGRLADALELVRPFEDTISKALYHSRRAGLFVAAGEQALALAETERAAEASPGDPVLLLGLATMLIIERRDLARADDLLKQAKTHVIPDVVRFGVVRTEGMLEVERGNAIRAVALLDDALSKMPRPETLPTIVVAEAGARAYLTLACAALGNQRRALEEFARAEPMIRAHHRDQLLARCLAAIGRG
jgi:tetratricopeptide (TPR) repeat protein